MIIYLLLNKMLHHAFEVCNFLIVKMTHFRCQNRIVIRKITNKTKAEKNLHYTVKKNRWTQIRTSARIFLGIIVRQQSTVCNSPGHLPAISQKEQELFKSSSRLKSVGGGGGGGEQQETSAWVQDIVQHTRCLSSLRLVYYSGTSIKRTSKKCFYFLFESAQLTTCTYTDWQGIPHLRSCV